jgi:hypothetical protein
MSTLALTYPELSPKGSSSSAPLKCCVKVLSRGTNSKEHPNMDVKFAIKHNQSRAIDMQM